MSRCADHVELGWLLGVCALEVNFLCALCDVQAVLVTHLKGLSVCCDSSLSADIEDTNLTALQKIVGAKVLPAVNPLINRHLFCRRHTTQCHHTVYVGINGNYLICLIQACDQEFIS